MGALNVFPSECACAAMRMKLKDILLFLGMSINTLQYEWVGIIFLSNEFSKNVYIQSQFLMIITMAIYSYSDF